MKVDLDSTYKLLTMDDDDKHDGEYDNEEEDEYVPPSGCFWFHPLNI